MQLIKNGDTSQPIVFLLVQSGDHISPLTGASPTVTVSKNGGTFAAGGGTTTEIGNGLYKYSPAAAEVITNGILALHVTAASGDPQDKLCQVVPGYPGDVSTYAGQAAQLDSNNLPKVGIGAVNGSTNAAVSLQDAADSMAVGVVAAAATTTTIPTSSLSPANVTPNQFQGCVLKFRRDTATPALRGQTTSISGDNGAGTLTVVALTTAPAVGDTFVIL